MRSRPILLGLGVLVLVAGGIGGYQFYNVSKAYESTRSDLAVATSSLASVQQSLAVAENDKKELSEALDAERRKNETFESKISEISGTVGKLDKLSKTDPELLAKYSKVYFLNENYAPSSLTEIDEKYWFNADKPEQIHSEVSKFLEDMLEDAHDDEIDLRVVSAYRSFTRQGELKSNYRMTYGSGANAFSADQGYSEHQLGTTVDLSTPEVGGSFVGFENSEAFDWLKKNAFKYGFVLSYPEGNKFYHYEPWHWRFVGRDLAEDLYDDEKSFYDLDQRVIDEYLISLFD